VPDFDAAVVWHRLLDGVERSAESATGHALAMPAKVVGTSPVQHR
jgi:hypothetical protein